MCKETSEGLSKLMQILLRVTILLTVAYETHWFAYGGLVLLKELTVLTVEQGLETIAV